MPALKPGELRLGRIVHRADFERLLAAPAWSRSAHFALHHVSVAPGRPKQGSQDIGEADLPTDLNTDGKAPVDKSVPKRWFGALVPKRNARRSVTRSLLKRQIRCAFERHANQLPAGQWLVRLRSPFTPKQFVSARSQALAEAARDELEQLMRTAPRRQR